MNAEVDPHEERCTICYACMKDRKSCFAGYYVNGVAVYMWLCVCRVLDYAHVYVYVCMCVCVCVCMCA